MPKAAANPKAAVPEKKAKRAKKDPNAPKRALSAYMFFVNSNRESVITKNPGIGFGEVGKVLGAQWKSLTDAQKTPYNKQAEQDKVRAAKEMETFKAGGSAPVAAAKKPASKKAAKAAPAPVEEEDDDDEEESD